MEEKRLGEVISPEEIETKEREPISCVQIYGYEAQAFKNVLDGIDLDSVILPGNDSELKEVAKKAHDKAVESIATLVKLAEKGIILEDTGNESSHPDEDEAQGEPTPTT